MEPVAACEGVALELLVVAFVAVADPGTLGLEVVHRDVLHLELQWALVVEPEADEVLTSSVYP